MEVEVIVVVPVIEILIQPSPLSQLLGATMNLISGDLGRSEPFVRKEGYREGIIKGDFKAIEDAEVIPGRGWSVSGGGDSLEPIIIHKVILR